MQFIGPSILQVDEGDPLVLLAGIQIGCYELFGTERVRAIRDLKGKTVAAGPVRGSGHTFLASMAAFVGLKPSTDITWVDSSDREALRLFAEGKVDALMASPPRAQEARARQLGHLIVSTVRDRPWSQYFCCLVVAGREFTAKYPGATKRAVRAFLKAADLCAQEPERVKGSEPGGMDDIFLLPGFDTSGPGSQQRIIDDEFNHIIKEFEARGAQLLFIADTCHGGGMTREGDPIIREPGTSDKVRMRAASCQRRNSSTSGARTHCRGCAPRGPSSGEMCGPST